MVGNGPLNTSPIVASDEMFWVRARGDYASLANSSEQLAAGADGVISSGTPWQLTSATIDFEAQGVQAQNVVLLTNGTPRGSFPGSGRYFAVDSASSTTLTLRVIGKPLNVGQPPAIAGATGVTFVVNTFQTLLEDASWDLKQRFSLDEAIPFRASQWMYAGVEDPLRDLRAACVLQALLKAYQAEARTEKGDWAMKISRVSREYQEVLDRVQIRWGPWGNSQEPTSLFSLRISR